MLLHSLLPGRKIIWKKNAQKKVEGKIIDEKKHQHVRQEFLQEKLTIWGQKKIIIIFIVVLVRVSSVFSFF